MQIDFDSSPKLNFKEEKHLILVNRKCTVMPQCIDVIAFVLFDKWALLSLYMLGQYLEILCGIVWQLEFTVLVQTRYRKPLNANC